MWSIKEIIFIEKAKQNKISYARGGQWLGNFFFFFKNVFWTRLSTAANFSVLDLCSLTTHTLSQINILLNVWRAHKFLTCLIYKGSAHSVQETSFTDTKGAKTAPTELSQTEVVVVLLVCLLVCLFHCVVWRQYLSK